MHCLRGAPFVYWLNSDDRLLPGGLRHLIRAMERNPDAPAAYGMVENYHKGVRQPIVQIERFDARRLAVQCIVSQPGTLIRRTAWEKVEGLREKLHMALDYDLWWRLYKRFGPMVHIDAPIAVNRDHPYSKTNRHRVLHYREAMAVVKQYHGRRPLKWWRTQPRGVWLKGLQGWWQRRR